MSLVRLFRFEIVCCLFIERYNLLLYLDKLFDWENKLCLFCISVFVNILLSFVIILILKLILKMICC